MAWRSNHIGNEKNQNACKLANKALKNMHNRGNQLKELGNPRFSGNHGHKKNKIKKNLDQKPSNQHP